MNADKWRRAGELYHTALTLGAGDRAAFLVEACGDDVELRDEVESLLARAADASGFLETPAVELAGRAFTTQHSLIGQRLNQYEIRSLLGVGGMGDVYLARDTRLDRDVAIKCLPAHVMADPDARARLEREARLLATLNHPNIAGIHGVAEADGVIGLVLELVEGRTLVASDILLRDAIDIARQIADALEAAHEQGIIHRDLKPANIKITPRGVVKVLDFGLAKAIDRTPNGRGASRDQTRTGLILGTAAYMSPEQARGKPLDRRTDIWSFGCVVYELLTRRVAFGAETTSDSLVKILESEPDWAALPDETPAPIRRMLRRCLEKDVALRLRDIADARLDIADALSDPQAPDQRHLTTYSRWRWAALLAAVLIAAAVGSGYLIGAGPTTPTAGTITRLTFRQGNIGKARFAPDGKSVIYSASWDGEPFRLYSTQPGTAQSRTIDLPPADLLALSKQGQLAVSPARPAVDGWEPRGTLAVTALAGGAPRALYTDIVGADWSPDGGTMAIVRRHRTSARLEFPVGTVVHEAPTILPPRISPDGARVCFFAGAAYGELWVADRAGSARQLADALGRGGHCAWTPDGREIWVESGSGDMNMTLDAVDLSGRRRTVASYTGMVQIEDIAADGKVLISAGTLRYASYAVAEAGERDLTVFDATRFFHVTPDGRQTLLWDNSPGARRDRIFLRSTDGAPPVPLGPGAPAALSADGKWAAVIGNGVNNQRIRNKLTLLPTGAGTAQTFDLPVDVEPLHGGAHGRTEWFRRTFDFSADGSRFLIPYGHTGDRPPRVYVYDLPARALKTITEEGVTGPAVLSPDGRFVAVNDGSKLIVHSVDEGSTRTLIGPPESGHVASWSTDGRSLLLVESSGDRTRVFRRDIDTGVRVLVREIRPQIHAGVTAFDVFVARDGQSFAYTVSQRLANVFVVEGLR